VKNDTAESVNRFPGLGEIPILGALFRSSQFQKGQTELMFIITPRLVRPLPPDYALPTDAFVEPSRSEYFLEGKMEGKPSGDAGGFDKKRTHSWPQRSPCW
jgi:pilus assembly protein CpaC